MEKYLVNDFKNKKPLLALHQQLNKYMISNSKAEYLNNKNLYIEGGSLDNTH